MRAVSLGLFVIVMSVSSISLAKHIDHRDTGSLEMRHRHDASRAQLLERVRRLERAVAQLQEQCGVLDQQQKPSVTKIIVREKRPYRPRKVACVLETRLKGSFTGIGDTRMEAIGITLAKCNKSFGGSNIFCQRKEVKCD